MRKLFVAACVALALAASASPVSGIGRGGVPDGDDHPYVGLMLALDVNGTPLWRCTGTLISPTVYVTAGHCTEPPAAQAEVFFQTTLEPRRADFGWPAGPYNGSTRGTTHVYPAYDPDAFFIADLGAVVLNEPVILDSYASLPSPGAVDALGKGRKEAQVTVVGYGLQYAGRGVNPSVSLLTRYRADVKVTNTQGVAGNRVYEGNSMFLSGDARHGGTCFGDSGGPTLRGDTLLAVTSYGFNSVCAGVGGVYRIDRAAELAWINGLD
jgi:V8-like Glu-specific endopeptidase